jgi:hypothetical protein
MITKGVVRPTAPRHPSVLIEKGAFSFPKVQNKWRPTKP